MNSAGIDPPQLDFCPPDVITELVEFNEDVIDDAVAEALLDDELNTTGSSGLSAISITAKLGDANINPLRGL